MTLGEKLAEIRQDKGLTQREVADFLCCASTTVSGYEQNTRESSIDILMKYAQVFHVTTDYLLGLTESPLSLSFLDSEFCDGISIRTMVDLLTKIKSEHRVAAFTVLNCMTGDQVKPEKKGDHKV